mmetsp:Transcript_88039/g.269346  ORF Transcript_88039/g.269346 Transcript_88039/m.269346 type:complete len:229 (-) Transcript_88039:1101-1787(-)
MFFPKNWVMASKPPRRPPMTPRNANMAIIPMSFANRNCTPHRRNMITNCWRKPGVTLSAGLPPSPDSSGWPVAARPAQRAKSPSGTANVSSTRSPSYLALSPDTTSIIQSATFSPSEYRNPMPSKYGLMLPVSPQYTVRPPLPRSSKCVNALNTAKRGWWMTQTTVMPAAPSFRMHRASCKAAAPSNPDVGSSMKRTRGAAVNSRPMLTRFFCPPLMPRLASSPITAC